MAASAIRMPSKTSKSKAARGNEIDREQRLFEVRFRRVGTERPVARRAEPPAKPCAMRELSPARRIGKLIVDCGQSPSDNEPSLPAPHPIREERTRIVLGDSGIGGNIDTDILTSRQKESQPVEIGGILSDVPLCVSRFRSSLLLHLLS